MYKTIGEAMDFLARLKPLVADASHCELVVAPPFTALAAVAATARGSNVRVSAQDVHWDAEGGHTGDVSPRMIWVAGPRLGILGHSQRGHDHKKPARKANR